MKFNLRTIFLLVVAAAAAFASWRNLREADEDREAEASRLAVVTLNAELRNKPTMRNGIGDRPSGDPVAVRLIERWIDDGVPEQALPAEWRHHLPHIQKLGTTRFRH